jgi:methylisocitrate lyase
MAARAYERLYATLGRDGGAAAVINEMQTREELYRTIGYAGYESLDASLVTTVTPESAFPSER